MTHPSVSFRISRSAEDLAETIHALSQRLVAMEHRLSAMEVQMADQVEETDPDQEVRLENVERLLRDCRDLLAIDPEESGTPLLQAQGLQAGIPHGGTVRLDEEGREVAA